MLNVSREIGVNIVVVNLNLLGTSGEASFSDVSPGNYRLRIFAKNSNYDTLVVIRVISVPDTSYGCAVNLINDGVTVSDGGATIQFTGVGDMTAFTCFLDGEIYSDECKFLPLSSSLYSQSSWL